MLQNHLSYTLNLINLGIWPNTLHVSIKLISFFRFLDLQSSLIQSSVACYVCWLYFLSNIWVMSNPLGNLSFMMNNSTNAVTNIFIVKRFGDSILHLQWIYSEDHISKEINLKQIKKIYIRNYKRYETLKTLWI